MGAHRLASAGEVALKRAPTFSWLGAFDRGASEHCSATWKWRGRRRRMHTVAHRGFAADTKDDDGVVRIRGGVGGPENIGGFATLDGSGLGRRHGAHDVRTAAETAEDRGI